MVVSEEIGFHKPDPMIYQHALDQAEHQEKESVIMIGDRLDSDILGGNNFGIQTCWFNRSKKMNKTGIVPNFEITELKEIFGLTPRPSS